MKKMPLVKLQPDDVQSAISLYQSGLSLQKVAETFGVSRQSMWDLLRRRIELRPQQRHGKENHFYRGGIKASDKAQGRIEKAIAKGKIKRPEKCEMCGEIPPPMKNGRLRIQAHHPDYNNPFKIIWLCQGCHYKWHKENDPVVSLC